MRPFVLGGLLTGSVGGLSGYAVAGWPGLVWGVCLALAAVALIARLQLEEERLPPGPSVLDSEPGHAGEYPQYEQLASQLRWALRDGRYFGRVVTPSLRHLAHEIAAHRRGRDLSDAQLAAALGPDASTLLMTDAVHRDRDDVPSDADVAAVLSAIEEL